MTKKKNFYYVLVFTETGAVYVTGVNWKNKTANWNREEKPLEMGQSTAENLVFGLNCNFTNAVLVKHPYEIETQPYNYKDFECKFTRKD